MSSQGFDASSVKRSTWIAGGGAVVLLISTLVSWWKVSVSFLGQSVSGSESGWDTGALGKLVFLVALIAIALVVVDHMKIDVSQMPVPVSLALLGAGALAVLLVVIRAIDTPDHVDWAWGLYLAFIASLVLTYGGWLKLQEES
jgi:hypothetical protein